MTQFEDAKEKVKDQFARNAEQYVSSKTHANGDDLDLLSEWLQLKPHWKVLDVATGGGHVAKKLAPFAASVTAVDLTRRMLETARNFISQQSDHVGYVVADAENLPFLDESFDAVTCRIAAHHFPNPGQFVNEAARVLKPGGRLLLIDNVVPDHDSIDDFVNTLERLRDESHVRCSRIREWEEWMKIAGFRELKSRIRKKAFDYPTWVRRTARSEEQVEAVSNHILQGNDEMREYCGLVMKDGAISSIHIDEWMVMLEKV
ncbi:class I SAM-dependent methyltransferase [Paenibacillus sp. N4]|uniref:class I SAM-dependent methyltransferase n=1 Tax=Paenibacillus vietnamensis TaxID=2590547 RepID=UPI001CD11224|nr:class I SAM-dependent methyltransferase [Paenibacillus vietnamensis]MCA0755800.1 class I SAM-dependent methyltransferase [Paenibacillus vietnamensis]